MTRFLAGGLAALYLLHGGIAAAAPIGAWLDDVDAIVADIRATHPQPFAKTGELTFMRRVDALKERIPTLTEDQRLVETMRLVALLGDGHTQLEPDTMAWAYWYPFRLYQFSDGYFITSAHSSVADLAGAQVLEIADRPVEAVVTDARTLVGIENRFDGEERLFAVHSAPMMKGMGYADPEGRLKLKLRLRDGKVVTRTLSPHQTDNPRFLSRPAGFEWQFPPETYGMPFGTNADWISAYKNLPADAYLKRDDTRPVFLTQRLAYVARAIPEHDAYFVQINQVDDTRFVSFMNETLADIDKRKPRRLIVDFRFNFGGDGSRVNEVMQSIVRRQPDTPWKELYVLTGRKTFSAGILAIGGLFKATPHTVVGEPTGAALNHFGDPVEHPFSRTGLKLSVSTVRHQLSGYLDRSEFIPVDVPGIFSFADYVAGRDPAVDPILAGQEMRSLQLIAMSDGAAKAREAYADRAKRFAGYGWWRPPSEEALRETCHALGDAGRVQDALSFCKLSTEIYPTNWHSWYNYGGAQKATEHPEARYSSYACVLALDPTNHNAPSFRELFAKLPAPPTPPAACPAGR